MITAAFETSSRPGSVALWTGSQMVGERLADARKHASDLLPALARLLAEAHLDVRQLDAVCVGTGPGSYTGLRVAVATALGLAHSTGAQLRAVPSFEALAYQTCAPGEEACIALDARAGGWYFARYTRTDEGVVSREDPCVLDGGEVLARLESAERGSIDDGVVQLLAANEQDATRFSTTACPEATSVARLGMLALLSEGPHGPEECEPLYLRPFAVKRRGRRDA